MGGPAVVGSIVDFAVLEYMPDAVLVTTPDGTVAYVNRAGELLFGYDRAEILGKPLEILIPSRFRSVHRAEREAYNSAPRVRPMGVGLDLQALTKNGHEIPVEISLAPLPQTGPEIFTIAAIRDVTERKRLEERSRLAERAEQEIRHRDEVLAVASHELRGPVGIVQMQANMLIRSASETVVDVQSMLRRMQMIERSALQLTKLLDGLLDTRQAAGADLRLKLEDFDLADLVRDVVDRLRETVERTGASLTLSVVAGSVRGRWDPMRLDQVITNLVVNAAKFGGSKPVKVAVDADAERARIAVSDEGVGIDVTDHERIFERYVQIGAHLGIPGVGLGLHIVRQIVQAHGGRVFVHSALGSGSTFTVELPRTPPAAAVPRGA